MDFSLQLYSIREETAKDFKGCLKTIAQQGYSGVEFAGYGGLSAEEMKAELDKNGLYSIGSHTSIDLFENALRENLEYNKKIGSKYMLIPSAPCASREDVDYVIKLLNESAKVAKEYGITVGYHNHAAEFEKIDGKYILDILAEETTDDVAIELDVYWAAKAGADPYDFIERNINKVKLIHVKQLGSDGENSLCPDGVLDFKKMIEIAKNADYFIVEQEGGGTDPITAAKINIDYLKSL